jgi:hypothetical protein
MVGPGSHSEDVASEAKWIHNIAAGVRFLYTVKFN